MILFMTVVIALLPHVIWLVMWIAGKIFRFSVNYSTYGWTSVGLVSLAWALLAYGFLGANPEITVMTLKRKKFAM